MRHLVTLETPNNDKSLSKDGLLSPCKVILGAYFSARGGPDLLDPPNPQPTDSEFAKIESITYMWWHCEVVKSL